MFSLANGEMTAIHPEFFEDDSILVSWQDINHRKLYVVSKKGTLKVINISNGSEIRKIDKLHCRPFGSNSKHDF